MDGLPFTSEPRRGRLGLTSISRVGSVEFSLEGLDTLDFQSKHRPLSRTCPAGLCRVPLPTLMPSSDTQTR